MKRALIVLGAVVLMGLVAYLAVSRHWAEARAARLDRALMEAEGRAMQLEADLEDANRKLAELTASGLSGGQRPSANRTGSAAIPPRQPVPQAAATTAQNAAAPEQATAGPLAQFIAAPASGLTNLVRIEGTSSIHDWQVEGRLIGGSAEFGPGFPSQPGVRPQPGAIEARVNAYIPVRSLKSVERDGRPYSDAMDEIMYGKLRAEDYKRIVFSLTSLTLKEQVGEPALPFLYDATGTLGVAGTTNSISMTVAVLPTSAGLIQFAGSTRVRMTDFKIAPPAPAIAGGAITTGDEVTLRFVWWVTEASLLGTAK